MTPEDLQLVKEVLEFYAIPKNWQSPSTGFAAQYDPEPSPIDKDRGTHARSVLHLVDYWMKQHELENNTTAR